MSPLPTMQSTANDSHGANRRNDGRPQAGSPSDGPSAQFQPAPRAQTSTVYVIDDEPSIRGLLEAIAAGMGLKVQPHENAESFLNSYDPEVPGCLLLDIYLPSMNGHELLEEIGRRKWELSIVVMSGRAEVSDSVRAFRAGSLDFLEKPFDRATVEACIRSAIQKDLEARDHRAKQSEIKARIASLTPRETQVMELVVAGNSNKSIAAELGVSPKTVEVHRANVMHKMRADSLAALVKMAMEDGIATCELE